MNKLIFSKLLLFLFQFIPLKHALRSKQLVQPFFVFGSGRNGSTLLNRILNQSQELFLPPEQYFLGPSIFRYHFYNFLQWRHLIKIKLGELIVSRPDTWDFDSRNVLEEITELPSQDRSLQTVISKTYNAYGKNIGKGVCWGDSTPNNTRFTKEIYRLFPEAKFIFLVRDGRDVVASYKSGGFEAFKEFSNISNSTQLWNNSIKSYKWLIQQTNVLLVRYEDLILETSDVLERISNFLEIDEIKNWEDYPEHVPKHSFYDMYWLEGIKKPLFSSSIGKWKEVLSQEEADYLNKKMEKGLRLFNYID